MISESDWKKFKNIKELALERFCASILDDISEGLSSKKHSTNHGKYLYLYKLIENYDKQIAILFNEHSRSKAVSQLMMLRQKDLVLEEELNSLSSELQDRANPEKYA